MSENEKNNHDDKEPVNIKHHSGFVSGLKVLLWDYREQIDIKDEQWLSTGGIRMDVLILKKDPKVEIAFDIGRIFKGHNIMEYKRPDDELNIDVFAKVMAYVNLYKSQGKYVDEISYNDVSATIYRHNYPRDVFPKVEEVRRINREERARSLLCNRHRPVPSSDPCGERPGSERVCHV